MSGNKLLLHACCGPCSTHVWQQLLSEFDTVTAYFFNPNIQPKQEYQLRLTAMNTVSERLGQALITDKSGYTEWKDRTKELKSEPEGGKRCFECIHLRLKQTFEAANRLGFQTVSSTLTVSRHKNSKIILSIGHELSNQYGISFYNQDFKKKNGNYLSDKLAKEWGLYRQNYCGCLFSKAEMEKRIIH